MERIVLFFADNPQPAEEFIKVYSPSPSEYFRRKDMAIFWVPCPLCQKLLCRPAEVIRDTQKFSCVFLFHISSVSQVQTDSVLRQTFLYDIYSFMPNDRIRVIESLRNKLDNLKQSPLYAYRKENNYHPVIGDGSPEATIMFVGEAPGRKEAETGIPFCGAAGKMLDKLLATIKLNRKDVYITNIVNDRPPDNRDPKPEEIELYSPFLLALIETIQPRVLVTLGRFSMTYVLTRFHSPEKEKGIKDLHGKVIPVRATYGGISVVPLYHPAFALYNGGMKKVLEQDFLVLRSFSG